MLNRRTVLTMLTTTALLPGAALARTARELSWDDLIPPGVPYSEIVGMGDIDEEADFWDPEYDENAVKLNETLDGAYVRMPAYIVPFEMSGDGVTDFLLAPYQGACIHVPPPPANQLVLAKAQKPWPADLLWDPVWATGVMRTSLQSTELGQIGYTLNVEEMEIYEW